MNVVVRQTMFDESIRNQQYNKHHALRAHSTHHIEFEMVAIAATTAVEVILAAAAAVGENEFSMKFGNLIR